jgi:hypothetical protein
MFQMMAHELRTVGLILMLLIIIILVWSNCLCNYDFVQNKI